MPARSVIDVASVSAGAGQLASTSAFGAGASRRSRSRCRQFPAAARAAVSRAYTDAAARPQDAAAVGALGRVLHAWEQWDGAHEAYTRAAALAPKAFEWSYLDAVVLQRLADTMRLQNSSSGRSRLRPTTSPRACVLPRACLEAGDLSQSGASSGIGAGTCGRAGRAHGPWPNCRARRHVMPTRSRISRKRDRFVSRARRRLLRARAFLSSARTDRRRPARARASMRSSARAGRRSTIRSVMPWPRFATMGPRVCGAASRLRRRAT